MNLNAESHFAQNPHIDIERSTFDRSCGHKTTFNAGELIPIFVDEVLPGDTFKLKTSFVLRMSTPVHPTMDNAYIDIYFFWVANRLLWKHWKEFNGENTSSAWTQLTEYEVPQLVAPASTGWTKGTLADYFQIPTGVPGLSVNRLPFNAYTLIRNEWFRDQNLQDPAYFDDDDTTITGVNTGTITTDIAKGGLPAKVCKYSDYFSRSLPAPLKAPPVLLPLGSTAPIYARDKSAATTFRFAGSTGGPWFKLQSTTWSTPTGGDGTGETHTNPRITGNLEEGEATQNYKDIRLPLKSELSDPSKSALVADLRDATAATINELRQAFQIQRLYERDARTGTRYTEILRGHFGVVSPDGRQQRPEYLGGKRVPINITQVLQTSSTDATSPQGNTGAFSYTADVDDSFIKSFTEHGFIIGLACVRTEHTYQQGLDRMWSRKRRFDYYWPALANIGEQAILNKEIYAQGNSTDDEAFGYQEAWADYRYKNSHVSGALRSNYAQSLDVWTYADNYNSLPILGSTWIEETPANIDRTLVVPSSTEDQFIADFYFKNECTRPMPLYSIPGLIDHH